jgi:hypothetical protein
MTVKEMKYYNGLIADIRNTKRKLLVLELLLKSHSLHCEVRGMLPSKNIYDSFHYILQDGTLVLKLLKLEKKKLNNELIKLEKLFSGEV